jgi:hypothetical protein
MAIDFTTDEGKVRLLLNDVDENTPVFSDDEITAFLALEGGNVKLAAAQAIDTNADNEALASKVLKTQDLSTDGAKIADALRKRAAALRAQVADEAEDSDDGFFFGIVEPEQSRPELTGWQGWL